MEAGRPLRRETGGYSCNPGEKMTVPVLNEGGNYGSREKVVEMVTDY